jgi:hypothetical protein
MTVRRIFEWLLAPLLVLSACTLQSSGEPASGNADAAPDAATEDGGPDLYPSQIPPDFHCEPTLDSIRDGIFVSSCGFGTCHGEVDSAWGLFLTIETQKITGELINQPAGSCRGWSLVVPGDPASSFLWNKITEKTPACGERMPRGTEPLPEVALDCIRTWITNLSPD